MEKEFVFLRLVKGKKRNGDNFCFMDYYNPVTFEPKREWYNDRPTEFVVLERKLEGKHEKKLIGICGIDNNDHVYIKDVKDVK